MIENQNGLDDMNDTLKTKQDKLYWEFNQETQKLDVLWILETEDGKFYSKKKSLNIYGGHEINEK